MTCDNTIICNSIPLCIMNNKMNITTLRTSNSITQHHFILKHFTTTLFLCHFDTHKDEKICGHLRRSHHPFYSTKIISLNITTSSLSFSTIAHKTIFRRRFSESYNTQASHF